MPKISSFGVPEFETLKTSTKTVMVYTNILFDLQQIFTLTPVTIVDIPLTKKKHKVDKKHIVAPYGAVYSISTKKDFRGIDLRNKKDGKVVETKSIDYFLNQLTIVLSLERLNLNIMMFKDSLKIVGCKTTDDAIEAVMILWEEYIRPLDKYNVFQLKQGEKDARFLFKVVMRNVDFKLGFYVDRQSLNKLMNSSKYSDRVLMSQYETTEHTNVNIKMFSKKPNEFKYDCLIYSVGKNSSSRFEKYPNNPYKNPRKKKKPNYITFIVFSSSEIILSGRYDEMMQERYEFFIREMFANKKLVEETIMVK